MSKRPYDSRRWRRQRDKCLKRDGHTCRVCGRHASRLPNGTTDLTAAHVTPARAGGSDSLSNLVTVCRYCHGELDGGRRYG